MADKAFAKTPRKVMGVPVPERFYRLTPRRNLEAILSQGLKPSIGERSEALGESEARIYLFDSKESLEDALGNWLGEEFDEVDILTALKGDVSSGEDLMNRRGNGRTPELSMRTGLLKSRKAINTGLE